MIKYANEVRGQFIFLKNGKHANEPPGGEWGEGGGRGKNSLEIGRMQMSA